MLLAASTMQVAHSFVLAPYHRAITFVPAISSSSLLWTQAPSTTSPSVESFIDGELRSAAMKLHTREQAPREGQAPSKNLQPYVTTHADYLQFLVDSQHVFQAFEDVINERSDLAIFRNTGLERTKPLEQDIAFMCKEYNLPRPPVAQPGIKYANTIRETESVPEFVCHFYNFYFAHTAVSHLESTGRRHVCAILPFVPKCLTIGFSFLLLLVSQGGRMIGKQMSALLLDNKTLEFYKVRFYQLFVKRRTKSVDALS